MTKRIEDLKHLKALLDAYFDESNICGEVSDQTQNQIDIKLKEIVYSLKGEDPYRLYINFKSGYLEFDGCKDKLKLLVKSIADVTRIKSFEIEDMKSDFYRNEKVNFEDYPTWVKVIESVCKLIDEF